MTPTGIIRRIDENGKLVIPASMRRTLNINDGDAFVIHWRDGVITLRKLETCCVFCGENRGCEEFKDKLVCTECRENLKGDMYDYN